MFGTTCLSGGEGEWSGSQGKAPVHRDNPECLLSLQVRLWNWECDCVYVYVCRAVTVIYGSCAQRGVLDRGFTFSSLQLWHQTTKSNQPQHKVRTLWSPDRLQKNPRGMMPSKLFSHMNPQQCWENQTGDIVRSRRLSHVAHRRFLSQACTLWWFQQWLYLGRAFSRQDTWYPLTCLLSR